MSARPIRLKPDGRVAPRILAGVQSDVTPRQARAFYRHPRWRHLALDAAMAARLAPTPADCALILTIFAAVHGAFRYRAEGRDVWGNLTRRVRLVAGRWLRLWFGDCDDFAILVMARLIAAGLPRGALRLCTCRIPTGVGPRGHMVLVVATKDGSLVCDQRQAAPLWADDPAFDAYEWWAIEEPPQVPGRGKGLWRSLRRRTLAEVWPGLAEVQP